MLIALVDRWLTLDVHNVNQPVPSWASAISLLCFSKASSMAFLLAPT